MTKQKVRGVGRDGIDERSLWVHFDFPVTDDDMRAFHDFARGFPARSVRRFDDPLIASLRNAAEHAEETYNSKSIAKTIRDAISALTQSPDEPKPSRSMQVRNGPIDTLPCDHCGHGIDEHLQPGLRCPENREAPR